MSEAGPPVPVLAGGTLDRAGEHRKEPGYLAQCGADPRARTIAVGPRGTVVVTGTAPESRDGWAVGPGDLRAARLDVDRERDVTLLGLEGDGTPLLAGFREQAPPGSSLVALREAASVLPAPEAGLLAYAAGVLAWQRSARFCGRCGRPTELGEAGHVATCPEGHTTHPRTDPVVIMLVVDPDGDRVLLGRQPSWPPSRFSALAGFVEPGESLEAAVAREVLEEARVHTAAVRYVASQPWPFPASLMLGFEARYGSGQARVGDAELEAVRWVTRDELGQAASAEGAPETAPLLLPPPMAIARTLIDHWLRRTG